MEKENEEIELPDEENLGELGEETDWKSKADELQKKHREAGIRNRERTKALKEKMSAAEKELLELRPLKVQPKSNEPDYGRLAYLNSVDIKHPDDQKIVIDEAERLKLDLPSVQTMEHIQTKLKANREAREAQAGMPRGSSTGGGSSSKDVDYWLAKGGLPADQKLAEQVVNARMGKESENKFSDEMFIG